MSDLLLQAEFLTSHELSSSVRCLSSDIAQRAVPSSYGNLHIKYKLRTVPQRAASTSVYFYDTDLHAPNLVSWALTVLAYLGLGQSLNRLPIQ